MINHGANSRTRPEMESPLKFTLHSIVFARCRSDPYWPAKVIKILPGYRLYQVSFFNHSSSAYVEEADIIPFAAETVRRQKRAILQKMREHKLMQRTRLMIIRGIELALEESQRLAELDQLAEPSFEASKKEGSSKEKQRQLTLESSFEAMRKRKRSKTPSSIDEPSNKRKLSKQTHVYFPLPSQKIQNFQQQTNRNSIQQQNYGMEHAEYNIQRKFVHLLKKQKEVRRLQQKNRQERQEIQSLRKSSDHLEPFDHSELRQHLHLMALSPQAINCYNFIEVGDSNPVEIPNVEIQHTITGASSKVAQSNGIALSDGEQSLKIQQVRQHQQPKFECSFQQPIEKQSQLCPPIIRQQVQQKQATLHQVIFQENVQPLPINQMGINSQNIINIPTSSEQTFNSLTQQIQQEQGTKQLQQPIANQQTAKTHSMQQKSSKISQEINELCFEPNLNSQKNGSINPSCDRQQGQIDDFDIDSLVSKIVEDSSEDHAMMVNKWTQLNADLIRQSENDDKPKQPQPFQNVAQMNGVDCIQTSSMAVFDGLNDMQQSHNEVISEPEAQEIGKEDQEQAQNHPIVLDVPVQSQQPSQIIQNCSKKKDFNQQVFKQAVPEDEAVKESSINDIQQQEQQIQLQEQQILQQQQQLKQTQQIALEQARIKVLSEQRSVPSLIEQALEQPTGACLINHLPQILSNSSIPQYEIIRQEYTRELYKNKTHIELPPHEDNISIIPIVERPQEEEAGDKIAEEVDDEVAEEIGDEMGEEIKEKVIEGVEEEEKEGEGAEGRVEAMETQQSGEPSMEFSHHSIEFKITLEEAVNESEGKPMSGQPESNPVFEVLQKKVAWEAEISSIEQLYRAEFTPPNNYQILLGSLPALQRRMREAPEALLTDVLKQYLQSIIGYLSAKTPKAELLLTMAQRHILLAVLTSEGLSAGAVWHEGVLGAFEQVVELYEAVAARRSWACNYLAEYLMVKAKLDYFAYLSRQATIIEQHAQAKLCTSEAYA